MRALGCFEWAVFSGVASCLAIAGCASAPSSPPRIYAAVPTRADVNGPVVPPVYLRLVADSDDRAVLQRATDAGWAPVCSSPCDGYVPAFGSYRVAMYLRTSKPFTLPAPPGTWAVLKVDDDGNVLTRDSLQIEAARSRNWSPSVYFYAGRSFWRR